jgi:hypothetical protein
MIATLALVPSDAQGQRKFTGVITGSMCSSNDHKGMRMGPTDAECTIACVLAHGASYILYDGKEVYTLSDQTSPEITGTLDAKTTTIKVASIARRQSTRSDPAIVPSAPQWARSGGFAVWGRAPPGSRRTR